jgi:hypothetical protein
MGYIIDTPEQIEHFRYLTLLSALKLETKGMRMTRGVSAYAIIKKELGLKGNKTAVYNQLAPMLGKPTI